MHISVMIPTYNRAHLIGSTIESILAQHHKDFDVVVVDDGSSDNSLEVIEQFVKKDPRVHLHINERNLGLVRNWNKCLDLATGPLVQIMQSDDLVDPTYFSAVSEQFSQHSQLGMVAATARYIDIEGKLIANGKVEAPHYYRAGDEAVSALVTKGYPHVSSIIMRRECYEQLGKFNEAIWHGPDMEMDARIASHYDYFHFGKVYTSFRRHGTNMGVLEYLRTDFLKVDLQKKRLALSYLSESALQALKITNVDAYIKRTAASASLSVASAILSYGYPKLSRHYLRQAQSMHPPIWRSSQYWRVIALNLIPSIGMRVMRRRMQITKEDILRVSQIKEALDQLEVPQLG